MRVPTRAPSTAGLSIVYERPLLQWARLIGSPGADGGQSITLLPVGAEQLPSGLVARSSAEVILAGSSTLAFSAATAGLTHAPSQALGRFPPDGSACVPAGLGRIDAG